MFYAVYSGNDGGGILSVALPVNAWNYSAQYCSNDTISWDVDNVLVLLIDPNACTFSMSGEFTGETLGGLNQDIFYGKLQDIYDALWSDELEENAERAFKSIYKGSWNGVCP